MKKIVFLLVGIALFALMGCSKSDNSIVIYSSAEENRIAHFQQRVNEQFPDYDITIQYLPTGKHAAKLKAEGKNTDVDIVLALETGYLEQLKSILADISEYDTSRYVDELVDQDGKYLTWTLWSGSILMNEKLLNEKNLAKPTSYQDLLKPEYKNLISMPNPKTSGTGYMFYLNLVNDMGEDKAIEYFNALSENVLQFTTSGSGPVNQIVTGEVAIGLGMTFQAVTELNKGAELTINYFEQGAPYSTEGAAIIEGKQTKKAVTEVFDFLVNTVHAEDIALFTHERLFKDQDITVENYPEGLRYGDMSGLLDFNTKEQLLAKWTH